MLRPNLIALVCGFACACQGARGAATTASAEEPDESPSFLVIVVDDWALSDLTAVRSDARPWNDLVAIDALAARGRSWNHFYAQPVCNPTRASLLLGTYVGSSTGDVCVSGNPATPPASAPTLAKLLRDEGYATAAFGKWHVAAHPDPAAPPERAPAAYGFDAWRAWNASNLFRHCGSKGYEDWLRVDDGIATRTSEYHTEAVARAACDWWQSTPGAKLAYVCFQAAHAPFHEPPAHLLPADYPTPVSVREKYEAMLVAMDTWIGTLLALVDPEETFVFLLGDNGTPPNALRSEQTAGRAKGTTWQDGIQVPLLVAGPGVAPGQTDALGHVVDLFATLAELAGVSSEGILADRVPGDSVSLAPVLRDPATRVRGHLVCDFVVGAEPTARARDTAVILESASPKALLKGRFLLDGARGTEEALFFDLTADPAERAPLDSSAALYAGALERIRRIYGAYAGR